MPDDFKDQMEKFKSPQWRVAIFFILFLVIMFVSMRLIAPPAEQRREISYTQFSEQLEAGNIESVTLRKLQVNGKLKSETRLKVPGADQPVAVREFTTQLPTFQGEGLIDRLEAKNVAINVEPADSGSAFWQYVVAFLPWVLIIGFWIYIMRRTTRMQGGPGGLFSFGQSKARLYKAEKAKVTFDDVAGMANVKQELRETIEFLKDPGRFKKVGAKVPHGVLLMGPPGTGKTLLARATAGEAGVPFYSISASEFVEMFVGVGASRVRDMFKKARETQPSIIFIDEIDAVGRTRGAGLGGGHDEREQTLNQLLSELDGFSPHEEVIVMAATNRPDILDAALLRPGRFDRRIVIDRPGLGERKSIFEVHVRGKKLAGDVDLDKLARGTPGMSGADIENLVNEAALIAVRKSKEEIEMADFEEARDNVLMGSVREETISELERKITAYHEAGHTLVAHQIPGTDPIHKVSILPRGQALGVTQQLPEEDRHYYPRKYLMNRLAVALAGRVAERMVFGDVSSGAQNDLKVVTQLAEKMVAQFGMSDKIGPLSLDRGEEHPFLGRELAQPKRHSEEMAWLIDQEVREIVTEAEARAEEVLSANRGTLDALAKELLEKETLERADIDRIISGAKSSAPSKGGGDEGGGAADRG
ncbi:MAG: ATP-dependent zinc metalloprotease FtsH [Thermodesulfovibrionales bacterium]